jgi:hypothetical protein
MKHLALIAALLAGIVGTANAAANADKAGVNKNGNECLFISTINNYQALDDHNIVIWGPGRRDAYLVELTMPLFGLKGAWKMATIDHDHDGRLCGFSMDRIGVRDIGPPESATIRSMTKLDDAGIAALEEQYKVSLVSKKSKEKKDG